MPLTPEQARLELARRGESLTPKKQPNPFSVMDGMKEGAKFARQVGTGYAGGMSGGLTDVPANAMGVPQSDARDIGGIAGMLNPGGLVAKAGGLGVRMASKFLPKAGASMLGRVAIRGAEGAAMGGATQLGNAVQKKSFEPIAGGAVGGGVLGAAIPFKALKTYGKSSKAQELFGEAVKTKISKAKINVSDELGELRRLYSKKPTANSLDATKFLDEKLSVYKTKFKKDLRPIFQNKATNDLSPSEVQDVVNMLGNKTGRTTQAMKELVKSLKSKVYGSLSSEGRGVYNDFADVARFKSSLKAPVDFAKDIGNNWLRGKVRSSK